MSSSLDVTLGPILVGAVLATFLFGIATLQAFHFYRTYGDTCSYTSKALIAGVWLIELGHSIAMWHAIYQMVVTFYGQPEHLANPPHSLELTVLFAASINIVIQTYFALRIRALSHSWLITSICSLLTLARFVFNMVMLAEFWVSNGFAIFQTRLRWLMLCVSTIGPSVDVLIAGSLCFFLWRLREGRIGKGDREGAEAGVTVMPETRKLIDKIILWSLETTSITSAAGVLQLILFVTMEDNLVWIAVFLIQPKLFSNSLFAHMLGRKQLRASLNGVASQTDHDHGHGYGYGPGYRYGRGARRRGGGRLANQTSQLVFESRPLSTQVSGLTATHDYQDGDLGLELDHERDSRAGTGTGSTVHSKTERPPRESQTQIHTTQDGATVDWP
ncbi:hypothetical protein C8F01DRAFT_555501 [Mycena amicta]|nr:hypothetical protein C8F01DRAFT_555501 [Mycena amicta]